MAYARWRVTIHKMPESWRFNVQARDFTYKRDAQDYIKACEKAGGRATLSDKQDKGTYNLF